MKFTDKKKILILISITILLFSTLFFREELIGIDTYAFYNHVCDKDYITMTPIMEFIIDYIPCDFSAIKIIMFVVFCLSLFFIYLIGKKITNDGFLVAIVVFTGLTFLMKIVEFEDDLFAIPFIFAAMYFMLPENDWKDKIISLLLIIIAGLIWKGSFLLLVGFIFLEPYILILVLPIIYLFFDYLHYAFVGDGKSMDWVFGVALMFFSSLIIGSIGFKNFKSKGLILFSSFLVLISMFNSVFAILAVPMLACGFVLLMKEKMIKGKEWIFISLLIGGIMGNLLVMGLMSPTQESFDFLIDAHNISIDANKTFYADWSFRHWLKYLDIEYITTGEELEFEQPDGIILSLVKNVNCPIIKQQGVTTVYDCSVN